MGGSKVAVLAGAVGSWALLLALSRAAVLTWGLDPWMFTFLQLISGGAFLLVVSSGAETGTTALRRPDTWLIGIFRVATAAFYTVALVYVDVMQASLFNAYGTPLAAVAVWLVFSRRPSRLELWGHVPILIGSVTVASGFEGGFTNPAVFFLLLSGICVLGANLLAERHPHMAALSPRTRIRVTGAVLLLTAFGFAGWRALQAVVGWAGPSGDFEASDLLLPELWIAGIGIGITLRGLSTYLGFRAAAVAGAHNYTASLLAMPLIGAGLEALLASAGYGVVPRFGSSDLLACCFTLGGGAIVVLARRRGSRIRTQS